MTTNCYSLSTFGQGRTIGLTLGIPVSKEYSRYCLDTRAGAFGFITPVEEEVVVDKMLTGSYDRVRHADIVDVDHSLSHESGHVLVPKCTEPVTLIYVHCGPFSTFSTDGQDQPHFLDTTTYVGAFGPGLCLQDTPHQSRRKKQLFRLLPNQNIFCAVASGEYAKITAQSFGENPKMERPSNDELADILISKTSVHDRDDQAWCFHAITEIGSSAHRDLFEKRFPEFRIPQSA